MCEQNRRGFTFAELLIVLAIVGLLFTVVISLLDPLEQIRKSQDIATLSVAKELDDAVFKYNITTNKTPYQANIEGSLLTSSEGQGIVTTLVSSEELKNDYQQRVKNTASELYFTGKTDFSHLAICFAPKSKKFRQNSDTAYDKYGNKINCTGNSCYLCLGLETSASISSSPASEVSLESNCDIFDSEKPQYPFTCNSSLKWSQYKCTNYCVSDFGCDSYCPSGERHLKKNYYAIGNPDLESCLNHKNEIAEDYCVSGIAANCSKIAYPSSSSDFLWGCSNPRRPYAWK